MTTPTTVNFGGVNGISGYVVLPAKAVLDLTVPAGGGPLQIPFPVGLSAPAFVAVVNQGCLDLEFQLSVVVGATVLAVPRGAAAIAYNPAAVYINSSVGGAAQVVLG